MPTNRTKRSRKPNNQSPAWAEIFLTTGETPGKDNPAYGDFIGWKFFGDDIPGLPPAHKMTDKLYGG